MDISLVEQCLKQLESVENCKILLDNDGKIQEIHITAKSKRSSKQISRDIQSILISRFGLNIDYKKISIAQIKYEFEEDISLRLKYKAIEYSMGEMKSSAKVVLEKDDEFYEGTISGPYTTNNVLSLFARATLKAVEAFLRIDDIFVLESVGNFSLAGKDVVVTIVNSIYDGHEQILSGSSVGKSDKKETTVKSTLDAVNRILQKVSR